MVRRLEAGETVYAVAEGLWLSPTMVYRWWRRYRAEGEAGLRDRSSRPRRSPLSALLQPGTAAQRARLSDPSSATHGAAVNNVFVNYI